VIEDLAASGGFEGACGQVAPIVTDAGWTRGR
jgi:hypothetical protein